MRFGICVSEEAEWKMKHGQAMLVDDGGLMLRTPSAEVVHRYLRAVA